MRRFYGGRRGASGTEPHAVSEAWGRNFRRAAPRKLAPSGGSDPRSGGAWGQYIISPDGPSRMVKRPTGSDGEPSSPNCGASAGVKARQPFSACAPAAPSSLADQKSIRAKNYQTNRGPNHCLDNQARQEGVRLLAPVTGSALKTTFGSED